jgi:glycosyltransferase involved in cell wall biosynthesis
MPILKDIYYQVKPLLPRRVQLALRRARARIKLRTHGDVWPIDEKSATPPKNWHGWPDGKRFAFVMTHDVETEVGLDRCRELMRIDQEFGIVSSFNFVPERYEVPAELREHLASHGFETAVQDLKHDGKLLRSWPKFLEHAKSINRYLKEWNAVGFRAGAMHHDLDWFHSLAIEYDASTFDYDPFEPQPDGTGTIFPFWVESRNGTGKGYVEMPYTLPQDFTLFVILRQDSIDLWKKKLDWLASKGGICLLITHPDYMAFDGQHRRFDEYPAENYRELLRYVLNRYKGQYYNVLPREIASLWRANYVTSRADKIPAKSNICMIAYSDYNQDARIKSYIRILKKAGHCVDLIALKDANGKTVEHFDGYSLYRLSGKYRGGNQFLYAYSYLKFFLLAFLFLNRLEFRKKYSAVHVHNMPNFLVFAALLQRLRGKRVVLDNHDLMIPLYEAKFKNTGKWFALRMLRLEQKWSEAFSSEVICADHLQKEYLVKEFGIPEKKITVILNLPHEDIFRRISVPKEDGVLKLVYHGTIAHRLGIDLMIEAMNKIRGQIPAKLHIYGGGDFLNEVIALRDKYGLEKEVFIAGKGVPTEDLSGILCGMDAGLIANRKTESTDRFMFPVKLLEYVYLGLPVIAPRLSIIKQYFKEDMLFYYSPENVDEIVDNITLLYNNVELTKNKVNQSYEFFNDHNLINKTLDYLKTLNL